MVQPLQYRYPPRAVSTATSSSRSPGPHHPWQGGRRAGHWLCARPWLRLSGPTGRPQPCQPSACPFSRMSPFDETGHSISARACDRGSPRRFGTWGACPPVPDPPGVLRHRGTGAGPARPRRLSAHAPGDRACDGQHATSRSSGRMIARSTPRPVCASYQVSCGTAHTAAVGPHARGVEPRKAARRRWASRRSKVASAMR